MWAGYVVDNDGDDEEEEDNDDEGGCVDDGRDDQQPRSRIKGERGGGKVGYLRHSRQVW